MSEGGEKELYIVGDDSKLRKIDIKGHAKRKRFLEGRLINGRHRWFGPRTFPFDIPEATTVTEDVDTNWKKYQEILGRLNQAELKNLSDHINKFSDDDYCEIIDVFSSCNWFRDQLIDKDKQISQGMTLNLVKILDLQSKRDFNDAWTALPGIIDEMVTIKKHRLIQSWASSAGVKFARDAWERPWKEGDVVSPVALIMRALRGNEFSAVCSKDELKQKYFSDECDKEIKIEGGAKAKVVDVLKSAYDNSSGWYWSKNWKVATKDRVGSWASQNQLSDSSAKNDLYYEGFHKGLIAEQCPQLGPSWKFWNMWNDTANQEVCNKLLEAVFGSQVNQKRYCLYRIPGIKGYLRTYHFSIFHIPRWERGDKFWAKCSANGH
ncbi:hypothetical protein MHLP_03490 [Candidatus Mycoplasma haematolamae str. Purdue]|uniref:Uncharacterized protein n=1 Tax=Mycoplasma haematolamae (strain Purdue) TaxID=1212765 RepID=I7BK75_MYCHA|nr:hypothetical protein [Candidatus Mycoplasma haematolamae]AFO52278.1 hypothetical protein MHLP_03490 [Candidatus Mycoplasma haematolamae str. Purdue]